MKASRAAEWPARQIARRATMGGGLVGRAQASEPVIWRQGKAAPIRSHLKEAIKRPRQATVIGSRAHKRPSRWLVGLILLSFHLRSDLFQQFGAPISGQVEGLQITQFRVPAFVPATLATAPSGGGEQQLAKPILFDCDYEYRPEEDARLTVKWFKNKEAEPFYQWLPELNVRHFADWIRPLLNQSFVSDPHDPLKRYRSLLIRRLSLNLTGQYTCLVSSLAGQDMRQAGLVVYQPPRALTFEHRIFPAPAALLTAAPAPFGVASSRQQAGAMSLGADGRAIGQAALSDDSRPSPQLFARPPSATFPSPSPTQFKNAPLALSSPGGQHAVAVRPANNLQVQQNFTLQQQQLMQFPALTTSAPPGTTTKIVYTHDGRPIRRKSRRQAPATGDQQQQQQQQQQAGIASWQLRKRLGADWASQLAGGANFRPALIRQNYVVQLHQFQCQASAVTPRPVIVLTVKRDAESIAQYLHEASVVNIRPHLVSQRELLSGGGGQAPSSDDLLVTLYDITVSATVALNVSLPSAPSPSDAASATQQFAPAAPAAPEPVQGDNAPAGVNTILNFRRGQRMSFECHLEITGTEFERRERIYISEQEVYQFAEAEEARRRARQRQQQAGGNQLAWPAAPPHQRGLENAPSGPDGGGGGFLASLGLADSAAAAGQRRAVASWLLAAGAALALAAPALF